MKDSYAVYLHADLLDTVPTRGEQRRSVLNFIRLLAENPFTEGDYIDRDASLRVRQIKLVGRFAVAYWADHAIKTVMVVAVRPTGRPSR